MQAAKFFVIFGLFESKQSKHFKKQNPKYVFENYEKFRIHIQKLQKSEKSLNSENPNIQKIRKLKK